MDLPQNISDQMIASDSPQNCNHHIDKFGNFYIEQNTFMKLENQQKIIINGKLWGFGKKRCILSIIIFIFIIIFVILSTRCIELFSWVIILGVCYGISLAWAIRPETGPVTTVYYNKDKKIIEIDCLRRKIYGGIFFIDKFEMDSNYEGYFFYIKFKSEKKYKILSLPPNWEAPFEEGVTILNDFVDYWKNKDGFNLLQSILLNE